MKRRWIRTSDHMAANGRLPDDGEKAWNLEFDDDEGRHWCIHVGPHSRREFLQTLSDSAALVWKAEGAL